MALSYGFYNSKNHDRLYDARQMGEMFDGIIADGVFSSIGDYFLVRSSDNGDGIIIGSGRAWFNHTWSKNDSDLYMPLLQSEVQFVRIDAVVLDINILNRVNDIIWVKGTPSVTNPQRPTLLKTTEHAQYPLAYIYRYPNSTTITGGDITNCVGTTETPFITGLFEHVSAEDFLNNLESSTDDDLKKFLDEEKQSILDWYEEIKGTIDEEGITKLIDRVDDIDQSSMKTDGSNAADVLSFEPTTSFNVGSKNGEIYIVRNIFRNIPRSDVNNVYNILKDNYTKNNGTVRISGMGDIKTIASGIMYSLTKISGTGPSDFINDNINIYGTETVIRNQFQMPAAGFSIEELYRYSNEELEYYKSIADREEALSLNYGLFMLRPTILFSNNQRFKFNTALSPNAKYKLEVYHESLNNYYIDDYIINNYIDTELIDNLLNEGRMFESVVDTSNAYDDSFLDSSIYFMKTMTGIGESNETTYGPYARPGFAVSDVEYAISTNKVPYIKSAILTYMGPEIVANTTFNMNNNPSESGAYADQGSLAYITRTMGWNVSFNSTWREYGISMASYSSAELYVQTSNVKIPNRVYNTGDAASPIYKAYRHRYCVAPKRYKISNINSGKDSISIGVNSVASHDNSLVIGRGVVDTKDHQIVLGTYNDVDSKRTKNCDIIIGGGHSSIYNNRKTVLGINNNGCINTDGNVYKDQGILKGALVNTANALVFDLEDGAQYLFTVNCRLKSTKAYRSFQQFWISAPFDPTGIGLTTTALAAPIVVNGVQNGTTGIGPFNTGLRTTYTGYDNEGKEVTCYHARLGIGSCTTDCWCQWTLVKVSGSVDDFKEEWLE